MQEAAPQQTMAVVTSGNSTPQQHQQQQQQQQQQLQQVSNTNLLNIVFNPAFAPEGFQLAQSAAMLTASLLNVSSMNNAKMLSVAAAAAAAGKQTRKRFTKEEDQTLKNIVKSLKKKTGNIDWNVVERHMPGRTCRQCRERFENYLKNEKKLRKGHWTKEEDQLLIEKVSELGAHWSKITRFFKGRSNINLKNHFSCLVKQSSKKIKQNSSIASSKTKQNEILLTEQQAAAAMMAKNALPSIPHPQITVPQVLPQQQQQQMQQQIPTITTNSNDCRILNILNSPTASAAAAAVAESLAVVNTDLEEPFQANVFSTNGPSSEVVSQNVQEKKSFPIKEETAAMTQTAFAPQSPTETLINEIIIDSQQGHDKDTYKFVESLYDSLFQDRFLYDPFNLDF